MARISKARRASRNNGRKSTSNKSKKTISVNLECESTIVTEVDDSSSDVINYNMLPQRIVDEPVDTLSSQCDADDSEDTLSGIFLFIK